MKSCASGVPDRYAQALLEGVSQRCIGPSAACLPTPSQRPDCTTHIRLSDVQAGSKAATARSDLVPSAVWETGTLMGCACWLEATLLKPVSRACREQN